MKLRTHLIRHHLDPAALSARRAGIRARLIEGSATIDGPMFDAFVVTDLEMLFADYDRTFYGSALEPALSGPHGGTLSLEVSGRLTRSGGMTRREVRAVGRGWHERREQTFAIAISRPLLLGTFRDEARSITVCGRPCADRLDALMRIFEHELMHLCEFLVWGDSNCKKPRFADLVERFFGHTEATHALVTPRERAQLEHGIRVGAPVRFTAGRQRYVGVVNRITRRATVLVPSPKGELYSDGVRYEKYYVPLDRLERIEP